MGYETNGSVAADLVAVHSALGVTTYADPFSITRSILDENKYSACFAVLGDSTGFDPTTWGKQIPTQIGALYPNYCVVYRGFVDDTTRNTARHAFYKRAQTASATSRLRAYADAFCLQPRSEIGPLI